MAKMIGGRRVGVYIGAGILLMLVAGAAFVYLYLLVPFREAVQVVDRAVNGLVNRDFA